MAVWVWLPLSRPFFSGVHVLEFLGHLVQGVRHLGDLFVQPHPLSAAYSEPLLLAAPRPFLVALYCLNAGHA